MKKFKFNLLAVIGMAVAVATVAFTAPKKNTANLSEAVWFTFESSINPGDSGYEIAILEPSNYSTTGSSSPGGCEEGLKVCAVKVIPDEDGNLERQSLEALETQILNPDPNSTEVKHQE